MKSQSKETIIQKAFSKIISKLRDKDLQQFTKYALSKVSYNFFIRPASSSQKYHGKEFNTKYGLLKHTIAAVSIFINDIVRNKSICHLTDKEVDMGIVALILHDTMKFGYNCDRDHTRHDHPMLVRAAIDRRYIDEETYDTIMSAVESHMGQWSVPKDYVDSNERETLPIPKTDLQKAVHIADYIASRKYILYERIKI